MPSREKLAEFVAWCAQHISGDEKGQAQIFLDRLFQAFGQAGSLDVGGTAEFRIREEFRVYDFDTDLDTPKDTLALKDLPERSQTKERKNLTMQFELCNN